tara:strand:- start:225 stop:326 length:102 start_codon:yes stop_codon:yes gene_type:complete
LASHDVPGSKEFSGALLAAKSLGAGQVIYITDS